MQDKNPYIPRVLIADDQPDVLTALRLLLKSNGFESVQAQSPREVERLLAAESFDAALLDMNYSRDTTSGQEGLDLVSAIKASSPHLPVIVLTAWGTIDLAVEAVRRGARDFLPKPWDNDRLLVTLRAQLDPGRPGARGDAPRAPQSHAGFIAPSAPMRAVADLIDRVGPSATNVLITGENGTGKGVVARALHACSRRSAKPLVTVNVAALPEGLFESELFGHVAGAFTDARNAREGRFELADGGTLFLDEMGNLPMGLQAKLLRAIETGEFERVGASQTRKVDVRLIAATNADLRARVREGTFREDLFYRLNTVEIHLPALRERRDDILPLAQHFLARHGAAYDRPGIPFAADAIDTLHAHAWPGNVRQLEHAVERAVLLARGDAIGADDLGLVPHDEAHGTARDSLDNMTLEDVERALIRKALVRAGGRATEAAAALGLSRSALYRRLLKYGFERTDATELD